MARLPFVVEPRLRPIIEKIGTPESGIIEVERRGYLTAGEKNFVQQIQQDDNSASSVISLSRKISREYSMGLEKAYNLVTSMMTGDQFEDEELLRVAEKQFATEVQEVIAALTASNSRSELVQAACMLMKRVDGDFQIEDVVSLHPDLVSGLSQLYRDEENRSIEKLKQNSEQEDTNSSVEEIEKKQSRKKADG